jgi:diguanylate cyclase (GGDEF)-like protein
MAFFEKPALWWSASGQHATKLVGALYARISHFMSVPADNPELLKAQYRAFSQQLPLMYLILMSSTWAVAITHMHLAPVWLAIGVPVLLTAASAVRVAHWWKSRNIEPTPEIARHALIRTNRLASVIAVAFTAWALMLFPYGDAYAQSHLAFYMAITVIGCIFCLLHLRSAAITVTAIVNGTFVIFFATTGQPTFIATAVNIALVSVSMLVILMINYRDFTRMIDAQTEATRREREQSRLLRMIDDMPVAVMTVDPRTFKINYVNATSKRTLGQIEGLLPITADELLGASIDIFHPNPEHQRRLLANPDNLPHRARIKLGPEVLDLQVTPVNAADGNYLGPMLTWSIVTQQVAAENRILQLAHYDTLTGLANRATFRDRLRATLARPGTEIELLFIDLDGFKIINDTKGHLVGDMLLKHVSDRLRSVCRMQGMTIGRLGGDEFAILIEQGDREQTEVLADSLVRAIGAPYRLDLERHVQIGASIGIVRAPDHGEDAETLLSRADMALYAAKAAGKGTFRTFSSDMETRIQERVRLESKLRTALDEKNGLFVFYQPIVNIESRQVTTREALVRWHHPHRGWISPGEFVPVAEESGLIEPLGRFVLSRACQEAAGWEDGARVAVNVSAAQLGKGTLAPTVLSALVSTGLSPDRLEIEVTETALLNDAQECRADLRRLRDMGVRVALDDFGTGYSSLAHLRVFPFDKIKIDGSFVKDAVERPDCAAVVKAVVDLGRRLGVTTVAEGVETEAHLRRVVEEGCREVQGYLFGRPMPSVQDAAIVDQLNRAPLEISAA